MAALAGARASGSCCKFDFDGEGAGGFLCGRVDGAHVGELLFAGGRRVDAGRSLAVEQSHEVGVFGESLDVHLTGFVAALAGVEVGEVWVLHPHLDGFRARGDEVDVLALEVELVNAGGGVGHGAGTLLVAGAVIMRPISAAE